MFRSTVVAAIAVTLIGASFATTTGAQAARPAAQGPCDIYAAGGTPCVAAHSTTRALYASYNGPLYQVGRLSDATRTGMSASCSGRIRRRGRAGRVLRQHDLLDHEALRPIADAQRSHPGASRRVQRPGHGRRRQPADR